jgi:lipid A 4'-phosphatase
MTAPDPRRLAAALLAAIAVSFAVFAIWPGLDLWVTGLFHDPATGFGAFDSGLPETARLFIWRLSEAVLAMALAALVTGSLTGQAVLNMPRRVWSYVLLLYLLAPGLLVDGVLKRVWGRARPADVTEFGGQLLFTPPHQIAHQCLRNCSFVSGEVAGAVTLAIALGLILHHLRPGLAPWAQRAGMAAILVLPAFTALQRIGAGRHFLSDAIFATLFVLLVAVGLQAAMFRRPRP